MISRNRYANIIKDTQLIACDLLIKHENSILLGKRNNAPAKGYLFNPGARMYKHEKHFETIRRLLDTECGISEPHGEFIYIGTFEHRYPNENFTEPQESEEHRASFGTIYNTHAFLWDLDKLDVNYRESILTTLKNIDTNQHDDQHDGNFMWVPISTIARINSSFQDIKIHPFVSKFLVNRNNMIQSFKIP